MPAPSAAGRPWGDLPAPGDKPLKLLILPPAPAAAIPAAAAPPFCGGDLDAALAAGRRAVPDSAESLRPGLRAIGATSLRPGLRGSALLRPGLWGVCAPELRAVRLLVEVVGALATDDTALGARPPLVRVEENEGRGDVAGPLSLACGPSEDSCDAGAARERVLRVLGGEAGPASSFSALLLAGIDATGVQPPPLTGAGVARGGVAGTRFTHFRPLGRTSCDCVGETNMLSSPICIRYGEDPLSPTPLAPAIEAVNSACLELVDGESSICCNSGDCAESDSELCIVYESQKLAG